MQSDENGKFKPEDMWRPRNIIFFLMIMSSAFLVLRNAGEVSEKTPEKTSILQGKHKRILIKFMTYQSVIFTELDQKRREKVYQDLENEFRNLEKKGIHFEGLGILQKLIIRDYWKHPLKNSSLRRISADDRKTELYRDFATLYLRNQEISAQSDLLKTATGDLVRIKLLRIRNKKGAAEAIEDKLRGEAILFSMVLIAVILFFFAGYPAAMIYLSMRRPIVRFKHTLAHIPLEKRRVLLESVIIFLFMFTTGGLLLKPMLSGMNPLHASLAVSIIGTLIMLIYAFRMLGRKNVLMMAHDAPYSSLWKEAGWGLLGLAVIYPLSVAVLFATTSLLGMDAQSNVEFAHPVVFFLKKNFFTVLIMASLVAPIIEELAFRNFLYGYLRYHFAVPVAALLNGGLFAVLHPQGYLALPALTVMGLGFAVLREIRPGILAPMITHSLSNGMTLIAARYLMTI